MSVKQEYVNGVIEWKKFVPLHWDLFRFRYLFTFGRGINITKADLQDEGLPCVTYGDIHSRYGFELDPNEQTLRCVGDEYLTSAENSMLHKGDFIFADTSEDIAGSGNFTYLNSETETVAGYHTVIARPKNPESSRFLAYLFDSVTFRTQIRSKVYGIKVFSITQAVLKDTIVPMPLMKEQKTITAYLDRRTAEIDKLLINLQSQADLLDRYKRELIVDAVTHGIDKTVSHKDSGVDWIGEVPSHWNTMRIKYLFKLRKDRNYLPEEDVELLSLYTDLGVIRHQDLIKTTGNKAMTVEEYKNVSKNDIIVNIILCWMGAIGRSDYDGVTSPAYDVYSPNTALAYSHYYHYLFRTPKFNGECYKRGRGIMLMRWRTYSDDFVDIRVPLPSIKEQEKIATYLDMKTTQVDNLIADINKQIEKLKQYRQIVIHDAVTGKIKVKEMQDNGN